MAVKFLTDDWAKALTEACNANSKFTKASRGVEATFQINVAESPEAAAFTMHWSDGQVHVTTGPAPGAPDVNLDLNYATMVELSKGTMNGPLAVATGKMQAEGNMEKMFSLGKAMDLLPTIEAGIGLDY
jgi:putative sterol carrier protein